MAEWKNRRHKLFRWFKVRYGVHAQNYLDFVHFACTIIYWRSTVLWIECGFGMHSLASSILSLTKEDTVGRGPGGMAIHVKTSECVNRTLDPPLAPS